VGGVSSAVLVQTQGGFCCTSTPKYSATDEYDIPPNHIIMTPGQPAF